jgi:hypothetical protein
LICSKAYPRRFSGATIKQRDVEVRHERQKVAHAGDAGETAGRCLDLERRDAAVAPEPDDVDQRDSSTYLVRKATRQALDA